MLKFLFPFFLILLSLPAFAQDKKVTIDVFASVDNAQAGQEFDIAIRQNIVDRWHTYWLNPGDSGEPMTIEWVAADDIEISPLIEPTPDRIDYDPLINFGHSGQPVFLQTITVDKGYSADEILLEGEAFWLVCEDICIPESQKISLTIPVANDSQFINQTIFENARANIPQSVDWNASFTKNGAEFTLRIAVPSDLHNQMTDVEIYPYDWGLIKTTSPIIADISDDYIEFTGESSDRDSSDLSQSSFVIKTSTNAYLVTSNLSKTTDTQSPIAEKNIILILIFAFIGGVILNLMPCVFPVLSMKAMSLITLSEKDVSQARASGIAYTIGIIVSFVAIAVLLIILKDAGAAIGWGFQLQNPFVVVAMATLLFLLGLNLLGVFEIGGRFTSVGSNLTSGHSTRASFFTGILATLVATPCSAPFMATAIGYALTQNAVISLIIFIVLGFGLAFPYLLLTFLPSLQKLLPKPGAWMDTFKQVLSFPMFASAIWLVWVLAQQSGQLSIIYSLGLFLAIGFLIWFFKKSSSRLWRVIVTALLIIIFTAYSFVLSPPSDKNYQDYSPSKLDNVLKNNPEQPVFINMTAAWCITCLVNERTSLSNDAVITAFDTNNVLYLKGDWTNRNADITSYLESYGRNGVPLYVFYGAIDKSGQRPEPILLPQILTPQIILNTLEGE